MTTSLNFGLSIVSDISTFRFEDVDVSNLVKMIDQQWTSFDASLMVQSSRLWAQLLDPLTWSMARGFLLSFLKKETEKLMTNMPNASFRKLVHPENLAKSGSGKRSVPMKNENGAFNKNISRRDDLEKESDPSP